MTKPIAQKSATYLKPSEGLTASQRRTLGLARTPPRKRDPREATPTTICNSTTRDRYRTGDGEVVQAMRPGSERAAGLPSKGIGA